MNHDVFISYSSKNPQTANAICHVLEQNKIKCWIAPRDIFIGEKYGDVIERAIRSCKVFIIVFSKESSLSPWVESELNIAFTDRRIIMPFRIDQTNLEGEMRLMLNNKHWIDAYPKPEVHFAELISAVARQVGLPSSSFDSPFSKDNSAQKQEQPISEKTTTTEKQKGHQKISPNEVVWIDQKNGYFVDERDNQKYLVIKVGNQVWMAQNLRYKMSSGCLGFENNIDRMMKLGYSYNYYTAINACPHGWHLPKKEEWIELINFLGNSNTSGKKLKASTGWTLCPGTNESGFNAFPDGGWYLSTGKFRPEDDHASFWLNNRDGKYANLGSINADYSVSLLRDDPQLGLCVRLIMDNKLQY